MNKATLELQNLNLEGNIIPHKWFNTLRMENGSPDYQSIILLSEIVYWYKPTVKFDEKGMYKGIKKKYQDDVLQKSYDDLSEKFGMTKRQVRDAIVRLESNGLIKREFRNLVIKGLAINNVLYIHLFVDKLKEISLEIEENVKGDTNSNKGECSNSSEGVLVQGYTYTDITTNNTTNNNHIKDKTYVQQVEPSSDLTEIHFEKFWNTYNKKQDRTKSFASFKKVYKKHSIEEIINHTLNYMDYLMTKDGNFKYQKMATTFLNNFDLMDDFISEKNKILQERNYRNGGYNNGCNERPNGKPSVKETFGVELEF